MAEYVAPLSPVTLTDDFIVKFEAISPTTGAAVAGVTVANAVLFAENLAEGATPEQLSPFMFVPGPQVV